MNADQDRVLDVVRKFGACQPSAVIKATKLHPSQVSVLLKALAERGLVTLKGYGRGRMVGLSDKGRTAAVKAETAPLRSKEYTAPAPASSSPLPPASPVIVEARDLALKNRLRKGSCSFDELVLAMPEERELTQEQRREACQRAIRRLIVRGVVRDVGTEFRLV